MKYKYFHFYWNRMSQFTIWKYASKKKSRFLLILKAYFIKVKKNKKRKKYFMVLFIKSNQIVSLLFSFSEVKWVCIILVLIKIMKSKLKILQSFTSKNRMTLETWSVIVITNNMRKKDSFLSLFGLYFQLWKENSHFLW